MDLEKLNNDWRSPFVARNEIEKFTQGRYKRSTLNTYDGAKKGIHRHIKLKSKIAWLKGKKRK